jgi:hypothetical protein
MKRFNSTVLALLAAVQIGLSPASVARAAEGPSLPAGTKIYLVLDENVSSARGGDDVGTIVRCHVWRDVEARGVIFIKSGVASTCRVDKVSRRNMGGFEGKVSIAGVETKSIDGQTVWLSGGYNKDGSGHKAVVLFIGILLLWPVLFVPGGNAELPPGTVFDAATDNDLHLTPATVEPTPPVVDLRGMGGGLSAQFMLDDFVSQPKHDVFRIKLSKDGALPASLVIDTVNGKPIDAIALVVKDPATKNGETTGVAEVNPKLLAKHFARGINRFDVAYTEDGQRKATEVVMDVQM